MTGSNSLFKSQSNDQRPHLDDETCRLKSLYRAEVVKSCDKRETNLRKYLQQSLLKNGVDHTAFVFIKSEHMQSLHKLPVNTRVSLLTFESP